MNIPYRECMVFLLAKGNQKAQRNLKNRLKPFHLTPVQALILGALEEEIGLTASELGKRLELDNATVSGVLDRLAESRWIVKKNDDKDRRIQRIYFSDDIEPSVMKELYDARKRANEDTVANLSTEERLLIKRLLRDLT